MYYGILRSNFFGVTVFTVVAFFRQEVYFGQGISEQIVTIAILEDTLPEPDEIFEIVLASPKNGLAIGSPAKGTLMGKALCW